MRKRNSKSKGKREEGKGLKVEEGPLKNEILNDMNCLFGERKNDEYSKFINENFELGKEGIIAKWIENLTL